ncbi:MAG: hypothetical protein ACYSWU_28315, partial [Planctomycetota bacterium]
TTGVPRDGVILEGEKWDGSDFISGDQGSLSKPAVDWLLGAGAAPFVASPCRMDVSSMKAEQRHRLGVLLG